jgi:putative transposase
MKSIISMSCPKCKNKSKFYKYGKTPDGYQKYQCRSCCHQFAPDKPISESSKLGSGKYPPCPKCNKASFLHHDYQFYSNYRCGDKKCYHSFFESKPTAIPDASMSQLFGKTDFKRMRYPAHIILNVIAMFNLGNTSFRKIAFLMKLMHNVKLSHTTVSNWCHKFAPYWHNISLELTPGLNFNSDEWHADETVVKIKGVKHWIWFIVDSETRFVLGYHLSPLRDSDAAFTAFNSVDDLGKPNAVVSDRLPSYIQAVKTVLGVKHIQVQDFTDDISNNLIECFNKQFKAWYKTKNGFSSFNHANNLIYIFVFFFNFVRPHMALSGLTPAQVAGLELDAIQSKKFRFVA